MRNSQTTVDAVQEHVFEGRPVSRGIAFGRAVCLFGENRQFYRTEIPSSSIAAEINRFSAAHERACRRVRRAGNTAKNGSEEIASIFDMHLAMLQDSTLKDKIVDVIRSESVNAEWAVKVVTDEYIAQ